MRANSLSMNHGTIDGLFSVIAAALAIRPSGPRTEGGRPIPTGAPVTTQWIRLFERIGEWSWRQRQRAVEAHLNEASDIHDLEARIRDLERGALYLHH